ncbi:MFS transporter [Allostreptomyces psammosilenae]|uniref:MFS family permease n=1 Tax=Allostreptomyces psammosilenae TaxID=1892865 RepID=A0A852ZV08_9ACTN|nr:MFS transporter [Allostreptomyces psammosilenae]NYI05110.1 MFS family permease [Allostreptomyces psammosilenae]
MTPRSPHGTPAGPPHPEGTPAPGGGPAPGAGSHPRPGGDPNRWRALAVCLAAGFMSLLDVSIVNVALPSIGTGLETGQSTLQWVVSGYALTFGLVLVPAGRLGDALGRRTMFMIGLAGFVLASAVCGLAVNGPWLVVSRLVQGVAAGMLTPQISALIQQMFRGAERGRAFGMFGTTVGLSTAVGPLLGGVLIALGGSGDGWRWVFYVNVPIGLVALPLAARLLPAHEPRPAGPPASPAASGAAGAHPAGRPRKRGGGLDPLGVLLLGAGVVTLLLPLLQMEHWTSPAKWLLVPLALGLLGAFALWEARQGRRGAEPVVDLALFRLRSYRVGAVLAGFYFAGFTSIFFVFTLFLQSGEGYSPLQAGAAITPFALGSAVSAALGGRLVARHGRRLVVLGLVLVAVGLAGSMVAVHYVPGRGAGLATALPLLLAGLGSGLVISPNQTLTLSEVPVRQAGSAGGVLQTAQRIGSAVGIAAVGAVFFGRLGGRTAGGDSQVWADAYDRGLLVSVGFVLVALVIGGWDLLASRRRGDPVG